MTTREEDDTQDDDPKEERRVRRRLGTLAEHQGGGPEACLDIAFAQWCERTQAWPRTHGPVEFGDAEDCTVVRVDTHEAVEFQERDTEQGCHCYAVRWVEAGREWRRMRWAPKSWERVRAAWALWRLGADA